MNTEGGRFSFSKIIELESANDERVDNGEVGMKFGPGDNGKLDFKKLGMPCPSISKTFPIR